MDDKKREIVESAIRIVTRYGIKKTSMTDISYEAGISRQTLYSHFESRKMVWLATIEMITNDYIAQIECGISSSTTMAEKLDIILQQIAIVPYDILAKAPELQDIVYGFDESSRNALKEADARFCNQIATVFEEYNPLLKKRNVSALQVAEMIFFSCKSLKQTAKDRNHLISIVEALKMAVLSLVIET